MEMILSHLIFSRFLHADSAQGIYKIDIHTGVFVCVCLCVCVCVQVCDYGGVGVSVAGV